MNMALPEAIQRQVDAADAIEKQITDAQAALQSETDQGKQISPPQPAEPKQAEPQAAPAPAAQDRPAVSEETWERKYATLQAKYNVEVPRLHEQNRTLQGQLVDLQGQLKQIQSQLSAKPEQPQTLEPAVTDKDVAAFGPDLIDLQRRVAQEVLEEARKENAAEIRKRDDYIAQLEQRLGVVSERQEVSDLDRFYGALAKAVPDWEAINTSEHFLQWLGEVDPVYGTPKDAALQAAYQRRDASQVSRIFLTYKELQAATQVLVQPELQPHVQPNRSRPAAPAPVADQRVWTQAEIGQFYDSWRRGGVAEADAVRIEAEIDAAVASGRVR